MGFPTCLETHRFIEPITVDIRPYTVPEQFFTVLGANMHRGWSNRNPECG